MSSRCRPHRRHVEFDWFCRTRRTANPAVDVVTAPVAEHLRFATWNVEWATAGTRRGERVAAVLDGAADVMVVTECTLGVLPTGHVVDAGSDWGYRVDDPTRRKVALWSRWPWTDVDPVGHPDLPPGRFVAATTSTPIGDLRGVGVCIP